MAGGQNFERLLFPTDAWKEQIGSSTGNRIATAHNVIHREILFGSRVIVQDGKDYFVPFWLVLTIQQELFLC